MTSKIHLRTLSRAGIATALYQALFLRLPIQSYFNAYTGITLPDPTGLRLYEKIGFE